MVFIKNSIANFLMILFLITGTELVQAEEFRKVDYLNEVAHQFVQEMATDYNLIPVGEGGDFREDTIREVSLSFFSQRKASIEEAREIEVKSTEKFLDLINSHEKIRPFLVEFPFPKQKVRISLTFMDPKGPYFCDGSVTYIMQAKGRLFYSTDDIFSELPVRIYDESYEEAVVRVKSKPLPYDVRFHKHKGYEEYVDQILKTFSKEMKRNYGLVCVTSGGRMRKEIEYFAVKFRLNKRATIEKARELEILATERLLELVNNNELIRPFLQQYPMSPEGTRIAIEFFKKRREHYNDGSVVLVKQEGGGVTYEAEYPRYKDKEGFESWTTEHKILCKEPFEKALQKCQWKEVKRKEKK